MERQRTLSERSFSSAESWELVKIEDHDKEISVPFLLEHVENSIVSDHSSVGHKSSTDSSITNFTRGAELPMENGLSVEHSIESSEQNNNGSSTASSTDGSSAEMDATNTIPQAEAQMPVAPLLLPNCPFPNFVEMKPRADEDDSLIESRVVHWLGLQRRQVGDSCSGIITNGPTAASPNRGEATTTTTVNSNNHYQTNKHIMTDPPFGLMAVLFSAMAITALLSIVEHFAWPGFQLLSSNYTAGGQKMAIEMASVELLHEFGANCKSQLEEYKIAYAASVEAVKQLQSEKAEHKKAIRKLRAEVAKLKIAVRSAASNRTAVDQQPLLLLPPACTARESGVGGCTVGIGDASPKQQPKRQQQQKSFLTWESMRANARTEYRWRRFRDNYSTTPIVGTFGTKFTKWLFERAALRQKQREIHSSKQKYKGTVHYHDEEDYVDQDDDHDNDGSWRWFEQRHKIRAKMRELCNNFEDDGARLKVPTWESVKEKLQKFGNKWL